MSTPLRYALITGAANGLGRALCVALAREGWHLAIADVDAEASEQTLSLVRSAGGTGQVEPLDVGNLDQWQSLAARLEKDWPRLDLLANVAGVAVAGEVGELSLDDWRWSLDVNLQGAIYGCHTFIPWLRKNTTAHLVNVASLAAFASIPAMAAYSVAKAGVVALSESLYCELRSTGVGVTAVLPGFFPSGLIGRGRLAKASHRKYAEHSMRRSPINADDVALATLRAVKRRQLYVVLPRRARIAWWFKRLFPTTFTRLVASRYHRKMVDEKPGKA